jgi:fucose permease
MIEPETTEKVNTRRLMSSACAGMFVFGIVMAILGAILPGLFARVGFDKGAAGNLFLYMNFAMLLMSLFFGPIVDRFGFKVLLVVCSLLVAGAFLLLSFSSTYSLILIAVVILGFGGGGLNGGTNTLTSDIHEPEKRGSALNILGIFFGFGALTIPFLVGVLVELLGLGKILLLATFLSLVPFVLFLLFKFPGGKQARGFPLKEAAGIGRNPLLWLCGFLLFFQSGNEFTIGGWISTYLQESFKIRPAAAALVLAGYWAAIMAGRLVSSRIVRILRNERLVLVSAGLSLAAAVLLRSAPSGALAAFAAVLIGLGFAAIYPTTLAVVGESFPAFSGTAFSVVIAMGLCGGMISPWLAGTIAQTSGLRQGLFLPVLNCAMIIVLQLVIMSVIKKRRSMSQAR